MPPNIKEINLEALAGLDLNDAVLAYDDQIQCDDYMLSAEVDASEFAPLDEHVEQKNEALLEHQRDDSSEDSPQECAPSGPFIKGYGPAIVVPKIENINQKYFIDYSQQIGTGRNTIVRKCTHKRTGKRFAVKSVKRYNNVEYEHMIKEANFLTELDHPNIIKLQDTFLDDQYLHMVIELCKGGELFDFVIAKAKTKQFHCSERQATEIVLKVLDAVSYLHENGIAHRDLKLENILFVSKQKQQGKKMEENTDVRLIDFGLSIRHETSNLSKRFTSFVGTNYYVAPEVLEQSYTHSCDLWSIGVLAYSLLSARPPFGGQDDKEIYYNISHCDEKGVEFPSPYWDDISEPAKDFIRGLLQKDASKRPSAAELKQHAWIVEQTTKDQKISVDQKPKQSMFQKAFRFGTKQRRR